MTQAAIDIAISKSHKAFLDYVWPVLSARIGGGELLPVESHASDRMRRLLDRYAGIDAWQLAGNHQGIRGIASRVQWGPKAWDTFTIRYSIGHSDIETEWQKRLRAIKNPTRGWLYPHITIQAYIDDAKEYLLSCAATRTEDLLLFAERVLQEDKDKRRLEQRAYIKMAPGGNRFVAVPWKVLREAGIQLIALQRRNEHGPTHS